MMNHKKKEFFFIIKLMLFIFRVKLSESEYLRLSANNNTNKKNINFSQKKKDFNLTNKTELLSIYRSLNIIPLKMEKKIFSFSKNRNPISCFFNLNENKNNLNSNHLEIFSHKKLNELELLKKGHGNTTNMNEELLKSFLNFINIGRPRYRKVTLKHVIRIKNGEKLVAKRLFEKYQDDWATIFGAKYPNIAPFGQETEFFKTDVLNTEPNIVVERISLVSQQSSENLYSLKSFLNKIGFINVNLTESSEDWDDTIFGTEGSNFGANIVLNPLVLFFYFIYSLFELFLVYKIFTNLIGNPFELIKFISTYSMKYFFENTSGFTSTSFIIFCVFVWFFIFMTFIIHLLALLDSQIEDTSKTNFSWFSSNFIELYSVFMLLNLISFVYVDIVFLIDFLLTRVFFLGSPGYPNFFALFYSIFVDCFQLLTVNGFFSYYLNKYLYFNLNYNSPHIFQEFYFLNTRFSLVNVYSNYKNIYENNNNFFLSVFGYFSNNLSDVSSNNFKYLKIKLRNELLQDIRKYNFLYDKYQQLKTVGQLYNRGFYGFNFRLDMQNSVNPFYSTEKTIFFDWRFKHFLRLWQHRLEEETSFFLFHRL